MKYHIVICYRYSRKRIKLADPLGEQLKVRESGKKSIFLLTPPNKSLHLMNAYIKRKLLYYILNHVFFL